MRQLSITSRGLSSLAMAEPRAYRRKASGSGTVRFALGLTGGMLVLQQLPVLPPLWMLLAAGLTALMLLSRGWVFLPAFLLGLGWAAGYGALRLADALPVVNSRVEVLVEGLVMGIPNRMERGERFDFRVLRVFESPSGRVPAKVRVSWYDAVQPVKAGQLWRLRLSLRPPRGMANPGGFDYEQWLFAEGIRAVGYVRKSPDNRLNEDSPGVRAWLPAWRQATHDRLTASLGASPVAGLLKALTMGYEDDITPAQWTVLRRTGTTHLIAISGSHIGLVAGFVFFLARALAATLGILRWSPPKIAACAGLMAALLYSALAGFSIPTQRALIMIVVAMGAVLWQRHQRVSQMLALALIAVAAWDPLAVLAPGFWLSFGAVWLIAYGVSGRLIPAGQGRLLWRINWVTALGLAPLLLLFFRQVSLVSPLANLLAVPVLGTLLIPLCLTATLLLSLIPPLGHWLLALAELIMSGAWRVLEWLSALPFAQWNKADPPLWTLPFAWLGVLLWLAPRGIPARWLGGVLLLPALLYEPGRPALGAFRLTLLDVGQGLSAVVETRGHTLIFDTGARLSPNFDMGSAVIEPYLRQRGIDRITALVISHGDNDHIGGARSVLTAFPVEAIYTSATDALRGFPVIPCAAGQQWAWDNVTFAMLGPVTASEKGNDNSCVLQVSGPGGRVLLTGDIEAEGERRLVARWGDELASAVLVVPHHGSKTSSTELLLSRVSPRLALIPAGYLNRFGFPHRDVTARYRTHQVRIMNTGETGAITVDVDASPRPLAPQGFREQRRRYWDVQ